MEDRTPLDWRLGIIILLAGVVIAIWTQSQRNVLTFLQVVSYSIVSVGITMIIYSIAWRNRERLRKRLHDCGIKKLFRNRREAAPEIRKLLEEAIAKGGEVRVLSVAATQFFNQLGPFYNIMADVRNWEPARYLSLEFALVNPSSAGAKERIQIEECKCGDKVCQTEIKRKIEDSNLWRRVLAAADWLEENRQQASDGDRKSSNIDVDYCFYDSSPVMYLIRINQHLFVEQYHVGKTRDRELIAGHMPVVQYHENSEEYKRFVQHFDNIWGFYGLQKGFPGPGR